MLVLRRLWILLMLPWTILAALVETNTCGNMNTALFNFQKILIDVALDEDHKVLKFFMNTKIIDPFNSSNMNPIVTDVNTTTNRFTTLHATIWFQGKVIKDENKRLCDVIGVKNTSQYLQSPRFRNTTMSNTTIIFNPNSAFQLNDNTSGKDKQKRENHELGSETIIDNIEHDIRRRDEEVSASLVESSGSLATALATSSIESGGNNMIPLSAFEHDSPKISNESNSFSNSNISIENLFSNSTGKLIGCPLFVNDSVYIYYEVDVSEQYGELGSFDARFSIISNDNQNQVLGCSKVYVTPKLRSSIGNAIFIGVLLLIIITGVINFLTITFSNYQESTNPFIFIASTICNENLLKQLDATVQRIILYFQFALFTAALNLNYPGFYQPVLGYLKWVGLLGFTIIEGDEFNSSSDQDNIYLTYNGGGLNSLAYFGNFSTLGKIWWNFILTLIFLILIQIAAQALFVGIQSLIRLGKNLQFDPMNFISTAKRSSFFILGVCLNNFMILFAYPFLVLTLYLFYINAQSNYTYHPNVQLLEHNAFNPNLSYDNLFNPMTYISFRDSSSNEKIDIQVNYDLLSYLGVSDLKNLTSISDSNLNSSSILFNMTDPSNTSTIDFKVVQVNPNSDILIPPLVVGSICFSVWVLIALYFIFKYLFSVTKRLKLIGNKNVSKLYTSVNNLLVWAYYYHHYAPSKNYFVVVDILCLFLRSIIISLLQSSGIAQVCCLIILEACNILLLLLINPFYLKLTWTTTRWMIPVAKLLVTLLCIPFLNELDYNETTRTLVAFAHFIIHFIIAIAFLCHLIYCFARTIHSIISFQRDKNRKQNVPEKLTNSTSLDDFNKQFEYQPLNKLLVPIKQYNHEPYNCEKDIDCGYTYGALHLHSQKSMVDSNRSSTSSFSNSNYNNRVNGPLTIDEINNPDFYYRSNAEYQLRNNQLNNGLENHSIISDNGSFAKQQDVSNKRKKKNDYTTREGDMIFRKYMVNDEVDPEIKELWESRNIWNSKEEVARTNESDLESYFKSTIDKDTETMTVASSTKRKDLKFKIKKLINHKQSSPVEKGFQVSRPRPLVVKTLSTSNGLGKVDEEVNENVVGDGDVSRNFSTRTNRTLQTLSTGCYTATTVNDDLPETPQDSQNSQGSEPFTKKQYD